MTTLTIGTATTTTSDNRLAEIRLFDGGTPTITFLNSAVRTIHIEGRGADIPYAEGEIVLDGAIHLPLIKTGARVEVWAHNPSLCLFVGVIEFAKSVAEDGHTSVTFQGRGLAAALVDARFKGTIGDSVATSVERVAVDAGFRARVDFPDEPLSAWVNAQSSYAVLRLLAASLDAIVRVDDEVVQFMSKDAYLAWMKTRPVFQISTSAIQSSSTVQGRPVKRRT